jgi:hypothetical protein
MMIDPTPQNPSPRSSSRFFMIVNAIGIVLILVTYFMGHKLLGLNLLGALAVWFLSQSILIWWMIR